MTALFSRRNARTLSIPHEINPAAKGDLGEIAVAKALMKQGLTVFSQIGNNSRVDLIVMDADGRLYKVQVKCTTSINGSALLNLRKITLNPKYNYHYSESDADVFALYVDDWDEVAFIKSGQIFESKAKCHSVTFRRTPGQANQYETKFMKDYNLFLGNMDT